MFIIVNIDNTIANLKPVAGQRIPADLPGDFYFRFTRNLMFRVKPYPGAAKTLQYISEYMDITYITARPTEIAFITVRWLEVNKFPSGEILFLPPEKRYFPDATAVIDDDPRVAQLYKKHENKVCIKTHPYNLDAVGHRFESWQKLLKALCRQSRLLT